MSSGGWKWAGRGAPGVTSAPPCGGGKGTAAERDRARQRRWSGKGRTAGRELLSPEGSQGGQDGDPGAAAGGGAVPRCRVAAGGGEALTPGPRQAKHPGPGACAGQAAGGLQHPVLADHVSAARPCPPPSLCVPSVHPAWIWLPRVRARPLRVPGMGQMGGPGMLPARSAPPTMPVPPIPSPAPPPTPSRTSAGRWWASRPCRGSRTWAAPLPSTSR